MNPLPIVVAGVLLAIAACALHMARLHALVRRERLRAAEAAARTDGAERARNELVQEVGRLKRAEADLRESEVFSHALFEATLAGLVVVNTDTYQIMDANEAAGEILGVDPGELIGEIAKGLLSGVAEGKDLADETEDQKNVPTEITRADGASVPVLRSITRLTSGGNDLAVVSLLDVSEQKAAEARLRESLVQLERANGDLKKHKDQIVQSEKLASIGQLAAGVAHEINNPVGFVTSNLGTLGEYTATMKKLLELYASWGADPAAEAASGLAEEIASIVQEEDLEFVLGDIDTVLAESSEGVERVAEIVQNLKSFAREDSLEKRDHDVNEGVEAMIKMVWNELKYLCEVERRFGEVPPVRCHAGQVNQVIMNMLVNASHAMPEEDGRIVVGTSVVEDEVEIRIADNGDGIPAEVLPRIFDPFFTTKDVGKGTGLGLAISHGIIQDHGGRIEVDSAPGEGTTFRIYLPLETAATDVIT